MRSFWPIYKRELFAFFVTPLAWVLIVVFLLTQGMHFFLLVDEFSRSGPELGGDETPLSAFFGNTVLLYMVLFVLVPPMTMRLFDDLYTAPRCGFGDALDYYRRTSSLPLIPRGLPASTNQ